MLIGSGGEWWDVSRSFRFLKWHNWYKWGALLELCQYFASNCSTSNSMRKNIKFGENRTSHYNKVPGKPRTYFICTVFSIRPCKIPSVKVVLLQARAAITERYSWQKWVSTQYKHFQIHSITTVYNRFYWQNHFQWWGLFSPRWLR